MRRVWAVCRKELLSYFSSPVAYIVSAVFLLIAGYFFTMVVSYTREAHLRFLFQNMAIIILFIVPMITMRLFAEERKLGTFELLMTSPIRLYELVAGKFLGAMALIGIILVVTLQYPLFLIGFVNPDLGPIATGYLGFFLLCMAFAAVGIFASSLTDSQIVAGAVSLCILLGFWIIGWAGDFLTGPSADFVRGLSLIDRLDNFVKGVVDTGDLAYYLSITGGFLFLTVRALDWRRW